MTYSDAILHIADVRTLTAFVEQKFPERLTPEGDIGDLSGMPALRREAAMLVYVRITPAALSTWRDLPGVTILAEQPYGPDCGDTLYDAVFADKDARAAYVSVAQGTEKFGLMG